MIGSLIELTKQLTLFAATKWAKPRQRSLCVWCGHEEWFQFGEVMSANVRIREHTKECPQSPYVASAWTDQDPTTPGWFWIFPTESAPLSDEPFIYHLAASDIVDRELWMNGRGVSFKHVAAWLRINEPARPR